MKTFYSLSHLMLGFTILTLSDTFSVFPTVYKISIIVLWHVNNFTDNRDSA